MLQLLSNAYIRFLILLMALAALLAGLDETTGAKQRISNLVFEAYIKIKPRPADDKIIFVDIDDYSLSQFGQWPWPRNILAELIRNIKTAGAGVIIFDGVLAEPDRTSPDHIAALLPSDHPALTALKDLPNNDDTMAAAIKEVGNFVAGFSYGSNPTPPILKGRILAKKDVKAFFMDAQQSGAMHFNTTAQFLPNLQKAAAGNGSFMAALDPDGVIRKTTLVFHNGQTLYPSLILEGLRVYERNYKGYVKLDWNENFTQDQLQSPFYATFGAHKIPVSHDGKMWIYYRPFTRDEQIPAARFLDVGAHNPLPDLTDKVVFIASEAEGLKDLRATPIGNVAGVKVHMNAMEQILQGTYLTRPPRALDYEFFAGIGAGLSIALLSFVINPAWLLLITGTAISAFFGLSWHLFTAQGLLLDPVSPSLIALLIFIIASALGFLKTEAERQQVRNAFGRYVSHDLLKELTRHPDTLQLGGELRNISIMFSDIRDFTTISEKLCPYDLIHLMNDFLTPMSDLVMKNRGTIDKYMGDAMMAFWNAPLDDPDHPRNACLTALGMQAALTPLNEDIKKTAEKDGKEAVYLRTGIGINTGNCAVGNMGSKQRFAYSTLGDPVNLASRLEGQTKAYGVGILIGETTYRAVCDFAALEVDLLQVKGKTEPVHIYALFGDDKEAMTPRFRNHMKLHEEMIEAYRSREFENALTLIKECRAIKHYDMKTIYDIYQQRCEDFIQNPPPANWNGVYVATSK